MPKDPNNAYGSKAARDKAMGKVREDIVDRDRADIDKGYRGSRVYKTSMGDVPLYPNEFGKLSKTDKMAYRDAVKRENRRGDNSSLAREIGIKGETGKGISRTEGDATRKRLMDRYGAKPSAAPADPGAGLPSTGATVASGNRMSGENTKDRRAVNRTAKVLSSSGTGFGSFKNK